MNELAEKILDALSPGQLEFQAFLSLARIEETRQVATAAILTGECPALLVNPDFVGAHANSSEKLSMLVKHEMLHVVLGHEHLRAADPGLENFVFDAVINAMLSRMHPAREHTALFRDFYSEKRFPECLLRPPDDWDGKAPTSAPAGVRALPMPLRRRAENVYLTLYSAAGASYQELRDLLTSSQATDRKFDGGIGSVPLLGSHGFDRDPSTEYNNGTEAVADVIASWPRATYVRGRTLQETLGEHRVAPTAFRQGAAMIARLLRRMQAEGGQSHDKAMLPYSTAIPTASRRSVVLDALGIPMLMNEAQLRDAARFGGQQVHVYLDLSGSMSDYLPAIYGALKECSGIVRDPIHAFSTVVVDLPVRDLSRGRRTTTMGTNICCVAAHIRSHRVRRAVVLTDGEVGTPVGLDADTFRSVDLAIVCIPCTKQNVLKAFARRAILLPEIH